MEKIKSILKVIIDIVENWEQRKKFVAFLFVAAIMYPIEIIRLKILLPLGIAI